MKKEYITIKIFKKDYLKLRKLCLVRKDEKGNPMKLSELVSLLVNQNI